MNPRPLPYQGSALPLSYSGLKKVSGRRSSNPRPLAWKANALPTELLPLKLIIIIIPRFMLYLPIAIGMSYSRLISSIEFRTGARASAIDTGSLYMWGEQDSNLRRHKPADLQSAPVDRFGISPINRVVLLRYTNATLSRADEGIRTPDLQITNQLLWPTELHRQFKERPDRLLDTLKNRFANV